MSILRAAVTGMVLLILGGCAVYEPYPAYPAYPSYRPPVVVQPRIYGYWYDQPSPRWGGHGHWGNGWHGHGYGHWR